MKLEDNAYSIVVVDNQSTDGSIEKIKAYLEGNGPEIQAENPDLNHLVFPFSAKPFPFVFSEESEKYPVSFFSEKLILIQAKENMGYGPGNNIGIQFALQDPDCEYIWILNNDTLVEPYCLLELKKQFESDQKKEIKTGGVGPKICYVQQPDLIQSTGSIFIPWICYSKFEDHNAPRNTTGLVSKNYVHHLVGASVLFKKRIFEDTGLLCNDHFVYLEEIDFAIRASKHGWTFSFQPKAILYHKEGGTISKSAHQAVGSLSEFYWNRNKILITLRYYPWFLPTVLLSSLASILIKTLKSKDPKRLFFYLTALISGFSYFFGLEKNIKIFHHKYLKK
jgi:hypothetical protein